MAQRLWLLRHGEALPHGESPDAQRQLTPHGRAQARAAGRAIARLGIEVAVGFTSPKVRAHDTARLACEALGVSPLVRDVLAAGFDCASALELALEAPDGSSVLMVGHAPDLSQIVYDLTGARVAFPTGAVAVIEPGGGTGRLIALLGPNELEAIAGA